MKHSFELLNKYKKELFKFRVSIVLLWIVQKVQKVHTTHKYAGNSTSKSTSKSTRVLLKVLLLLLAVGFGKVLLLVLEYIFQKVLLLVLEYIF